jgi:hypothetical protein
MRPMRRAENQVLSNVVYAYQFCYDFYAKTHAKLRAVYSIRGRLTAYPYLFPKGDLRGKSYVNAWIGDRALSFSALLKAPPP